VTYPRINGSHYILKEEGQTGKILASVHGDETLKHGTKRAILKQVGFK
jgi:predicted RNA binding protein YcfA (HicA-like mRNA interferase family)